MEFSKICVLGLGYIGLPTASTFAKCGRNVVGVDTNSRIVESLQKGIPHIKEPGLDEVVQAAFQSGKLTVASKPVEADAFIISVPTPIHPDKTADLSYVRSAAESILPVLRRGNLVVLESTSRRAPPAISSGPSSNAPACAPGRIFCWHIRRNACCPAKSSAN